MKSIFSLSFAMLLIGLHASGDEMSFPEYVATDIPGAPVLQTPFLVFAGEKPVLTEKHGLAAPALWDWDGDGKRDLLVGEFETNITDFPMGEEGSTIRVYRNIGSNSEPQFASNFDWARDTEGTILEVPQWCCIGFTPFFYDLDDDGFDDMITGQYHPGEITWFRGTEKGFAPGIHLPQEGDPTSGDHSYDKSDPDSILNTFGYWVYSSASMGDFDGDGDYDLITGGGTLRISENVGGKKTPRFGRREMLLTVDGEPLKVSSSPPLENSMEMNSGISRESGDSKTNPTVVDWDRDGVLDLLVTDSYLSDHSNAVTFFRGVKTDEGHRFEQGIDLFNNSDGKKALPGSGNRVYVDDWNLDGVPDLIIGASVATVNGGEFSDELSWEWESVNGVESAGKDPGLYPPREKPTRESLLSMFPDGYQGTDEELEAFIEMNLDFWYQTVGRLYETGKEHWLTMRHQGRVYVMLGAERDLSASLSDQ